ncbi:MAG: hypothetical protein NDJ89_17955 [Oligoflexia bacterium]|nr:hypothetical protein [Oligoflexia bacterium]
MRKRALAISLFFSAFVAGCSTSEQAAPAPGCSAGTAQILVTDGFLRNLCGCTEPAGTLVAPPATLTCTVAAGSHVFFIYASAFQPQQIGPAAGSPSFVVSPISDPQDEVPYRVHAVKFDAIGSYDFRDLFNSALSGRIVVQ